MIVKIFIYINGHILLHISIISYVQFWKGAHILRTLEGKDLSLYSFIYLTSICGIPTVCQKLS